MVQLCGCIARLRRTRYAAVEVITVNGRCRNCIGWQQFAEVNNEGSTPKASQRQVDGEPFLKQSKAKAEVIKMSSKRRYKCHQKGSLNYCPGSFPNLLKMADFALPYSMRMSMNSLPQTSTGTSTGTSTCASASTSVDGVLIKQEVQGLLVVTERGGTGRKQKY